MSKQTPFYQSHHDAGAKIVDFHGWQLPIHYGSQIEEHHSVRNAAGLFDVSHMCVVDIVGNDAQPWLQMLLTNDVGKLQPFQALYSCMCNEQGGVIDDLIVYKVSDIRFRLVVNAGTREKDLAWMKQHRSGDIDINVPNNLCMLAVQGPDAPNKTAVALDSMGQNIDVHALTRFSAVEQSDWFVGRTGYTGEDGFELIFPAELAPIFFNALLDAGVKPCGLGARDTLRLEAGMCLYGQDLDEDHSPVQSGIGWAVDVRDANRQFIGRDVLYEQKATGTEVHQVALVLNQRGVMRAGQEVQATGNRVGVVTSGGFSPSLQKSIALARVNKPLKSGCDVIIRDKPCAANVVKLPFTQYQ